MRLCIRVIFETLSLFTPGKLANMLVIPFISAYLNVYVNNLLHKEHKDIINCLIFKISQDYVSFILQQKLYSYDIQIMSITLINRINIAKINCGVPIPGINLKQHQDLMDDTSKIRDFLALLPIFWLSIVNFSVSIYMMNINTIYPVRFLFSLLCLTMCGVLTYFTDVSLYENTKPSPTSIIRFQDHNYVKIKLSMNCEPDPDFKLRKQKLMNEQRNIQKYIIIMINTIMAYISLSFNNIAQLIAFGNISWMIGCLADNIKSIYYYTYMNDFLSLCKCMENNKLQTGNEVINDIEYVSFIDVSFGYSNDLHKMSQINEVIKNLTYTFTRGVIYMEANNASGKSTLLRLFTSNLNGGNIYFGKTNRKKLTFTNIRKLVFHLVQASEYMPNFTKDEISEFLGRDKWLSKQLLLDHLIGKGMIEMSGGEKKRMLIFLSLISDSPIVLLDEIFSELSYEDTPEIPEGGGWLSRAIYTITNWDGRHKKIIIIVGHGLLELIPDNTDIIKLKLVNTKDKTIIIPRNNKLN